MFLLENVFFVKDSNLDGRLTMNYRRSCAASHASHNTVRKFSSGCVLVLNDQSLLGDTVLALIKVGRSASCRTNARQVSSRVGAGLDDGGTACGSSTDEGKAHSGHLIRILCIMLILKHCTY